MVDAVDQVKSAPLMRAERTKDHVIDSAFLTEALSKLGGEGIEDGQALGSEGDQVDAGERFRFCRRSDGWRSLATAGEVSEPGDGKLADALAK